MAEATAFSTKFSSEIESEERNISKMDEDSDEVTTIEETMTKAPLAWIHNQIANNANPRDILNQLVPELNIPDHVDDLSLWRLALEILSEPAPRQRLQEVNSLEHVKNLLQTCKKIVVLTGAGVSVSCGIPDFRSRDGIYARLSKDYPDLPNPQAMFDIHYFKSNQWPFFKFAKEIYPGQFTPSLCHRFISFLDRTGRLLRNYSQNIDTLEQVAGIKNVVQCHGSFATATCMNCKFTVSCEEIKNEIFNQKIPHCKKCSVNTVEDGRINVIKPDIVFFGESLPESFHRQIQDDKDKADLLIVIGSSLKVRPVSLIPNLIRPDVPQILINREPLSHMSFDVELYGNCDDVIAELCTQLGSEWTNVLQGFQHSTLDPERWKMFYDYCNGSVTTSADESESEVVIEQSESDVTSPNKDHPIKQSPETVENDTDDSDCKCGSEMDTDKEDSGKPGNKRKSPTACECASESTPTSENGSSPNKKTKSNIHMDSEQEMYYLSLPPNRYLFHGAELSFGDDSDSDSDTEGPFPEQDTSSQDEGSLTEADDSTASNTFEEVDSGSKQDQKSTYMNTRDDNLSGTLNETEHKEYEIATRNNLSTDISDIKDDINRLETEGKTRETDITSSQMSCTSSSSKMLSMQEPIENQLQVKESCKKDKDCERRERKYSHDETLCSTSSDVEKKILNLSTSHLCQDDKKKNDDKAEITIHKEKNDKTLGEGCEGKSEIQNMKEEEK
ncbi:NAD-dependent protein deacetylase sirtuin-1-like [Clytia hemisphaerica]